MVSMDEWDVEVMYDVVRRAAPYASLPRSAFEAVLDMLAGRYPSDEFAELRPRLVWDRVGGTLTGRPGAQRLAVTSGGTIPDRGLFGVFLVGRRRSRRGRRAGRGDGLRVAGRRRVHPRLDLLADRGHHPRPGARRRRRRDSRGGCRSGRATRSAGRSSSGGRSGAFTRELGGLTPAQARARVMAAGPGRLGRGQPAGLPGRAAPGHRPPARRPHRRGRAVPRRARRLAGRRSTRRSAPRCTRRGRWSSPPGCASATASTCRRCTPTTASCCGCPTSSSTRARPRPRERTGTEMAVVAPDEVEPLVTAEVGGSALFASRFRECAARALLLPRRNPGRRTPLWQQRQRSAQLLSVASDYGSFPVVLETMRECLQDVFDVPGPGRADARGRGAHGALRRGRDPAAVAVRPVAAVRLRRAVPLRGRLAAGRAPGRRRCRWTRRCWPSCSASRATAGCASCSTRTPWPRWPATCSGCPRTAGPATPRGSPTCSGCSAR